MVRLAHTDCEFAGVLRVQHEVDAGHYERLVLLVFLLTWGLVEIERLIILFVLDDAAVDIDAAVPHPPRHELVSVRHVVEHDDGAPDVHPVVALIQSFAGQGMVPLTLRLRFHHPLLGREVVESLLVEQLQWQPLHMLDRSLFLFLVFSINY